MPLYEYECGACHRRTEKIQKFSDPEITTCPFCGGVLARTITAPAIQFKGAGWYKDLYSSAKPQAAGSTSGEGGGAPGGDAALGSAASGSGAASESGATSGSTATKGDAAPAAAAPATTTSPAPAASGTGSGTSSATSNH